MVGIADVYNQTTSQQREACDSARFEGAYILRFSKAKESNE